MGQGQDAHATARAPCHGKSHLPRLEPPATTRACDGQSHQPRPEPATTKTDLPRPETIFTALLGRISLRLRASARVLPRLCESPTAPLRESCRASARVPSPGLLKRRRNHRIEAQTMRVAVARNEPVLPSIWYFRWRVVGGEEGRSGRCATRPDFCRRLASANVARQVACLFQERFARRTISLRKYLGVLVGLGVPRPTLQSPTAPLRESPRACVRVLFSAVLLPGRLVD